VLSGGEQQRLALARAWALAPEVLFLDEPTSSLDPPSTCAVEVIVDEIHARGTTIVMTTHQLAQAKRLADSVVLLQD
jgi:tungstate transport system ATP-binding protein